MTARSLLAVVYALTGTALSAQTIDDALRYSEVFPLGTARSLGTANSMSALGADWSAVAANPAGIAAFRNNDFTITVAGIITGSTNPTYDGAASSGAETGTNFALPQLGLVLTRKPIGSRWSQFNFGIGVSQSNRFEEQLGFEGRNSGSITDVWLDGANRYGLDGEGRRAFVDRGDGVFDFVFNPLSLPELSDFSTGLAFDAAVLIPGDDTDGPPFYNTDYDLARGDVFAPGPALDKRGSFQRTGRNAAIDLSFGANYDERFLFGATLALSRLRYENVFNYRESAEQGTAGNFVSLAYNDFAIITGTGVQVRLGGIYRASQALRIGLAYHSPSFINVEDSFNANLRYRYIGNDGNVEDPGTQSPAQASVISYDFRSPSQYKASVAGVFGKRGFASAEVTYLDYSGANFGAPDDADEFSREIVAATNDAIDADLKGAVQVRLGGEVNLAPVKLRAGFQYVGAPIDNEDAVLGFNAGIGFRQNRLGIDLGYQTLVRPDRAFVPYNIEPVNFPQSLVEYTPVSHTLALTLGWKLVSL